MTTTSLYVNGEELKILPTYTSEFILNIIAAKLNTTPNMVWLKNQPPGGVLPRTGSYIAYDMADMLPNKYATNVIDMSAMIENEIKEWVETDVDRNRQIVLEYIVYGFMGTRTVVGWDDAIMLDTIIAGGDATNMGSYNGERFYNDIMEKRSDTFAKLRQAALENKTKVERMLKVYAETAAIYSLATRRQRHMEMYVATFTATFDDVNTPVPPLEIFLHDVKISPKYVEFVRYNNFIKYDWRNVPNLRAIMSTSNLPEDTLYLYIRRDSAYELFSVTSNTPPLRSYDIVSLKRPHQRVVVSRHLKSTPDNTASDSTLEITVKSHTNLEPLDSRLIDALNIPTLNIQNVGKRTVGASFVIENVTFVAEYLQYFVLNDTGVNENRNIYIDERGIVNYRKWRRYVVASPMFLYEYNGNLIRFSVAVERNKAKNNVTMYTRVRVYDAPHENLLDKINDDIHALVLRYKYKEKSIEEYYHTYMSEEHYRSIELRPLRDSRRVRKSHATPHSRRTKTDDIRDIIGVHNYARQCKRLPTLVADRSDVPPGKQWLKFDVTDSDESGVPRTLYAYCTHDDAQYPGMMRNNLAGRNDRYSTIPCCYKTKQRNALDDNTDAAGSDYGKNVRRYFTGQRILHLNAFGKCPDEVEQLLKIDKTASDDGVQSEWYPNGKQLGLNDNTETPWCVRGAVGIGPNALLEATTRAVHALEGGDPRSLAIDQNYLKSKRTEMSSALNLAAQELFDVSVEARTQWLTENGDALLDPFRFVKIVQYMFNTNIYIFAKDSSAVHYSSMMSTKDRNEPISYTGSAASKASLVIPYHSDIGDYYDTKFYIRSVVIYVHYGTESSNANFPHVEYVMFKNHNDTIKRIDTVYRSMLAARTSNDLTNNITVYYNNQPSEDNAVITRHTAMLSVLNYYRNNGKSVLNDSEYCSIYCVVHNSQTDACNSVVHDITGQRLDALGRCVQLNSSRIQNPYSVDPLPLPCDTHDLSHIKRDAFVQAKLVERLARMMVFITVHEMVRTGSVNNVRFEVNKSRFKDVCNSTLYSLVDGGSFEIDKYTKLLVVYRTVSDDNESIATVLVDSDDTAKRLRYNAKLIYKKMTAVEKRRLLLTRYAMCLLKHELDYKTRFNKNNCMVVTTLDKLTLLYNNLSTRQIYEPPTAIVPEVGARLVLVVSETRKVPVTVVDENDLQSALSSTTDAQGTKTIVNLWKPNVNTGTNWEQINYTGVETKHEFYIIRLIDGRKLIMLAK